MDLDDGVEDLDEAFAEAYSGFSFERGEPKEIRDTGSYRFDVKLYYGEKRQSWQTVDEAADLMRAFISEIDTA